MTLLKGELVYVLDQDGNVDRDLVRRWGKGIVVSHSILEPGLVFVQFDRSTLQAFPREQLERVYTHDYTRFATPCNSQGK